MSLEPQPLLALDIGTRKVAGLVAVPHGRGLRILAARVVEHPDRAMLDGQVHKIDAVAQVVVRIKNELEQELGIKFESAAVAAAGRALLTESAVQKRRYTQTTEITRQDVLALELAAAQTAQSTLQAHGRKSHLHCVGYSAMQYMLDNEPIEELVGHQGQEISVEVLATFLPRQVVDSLLAVLRRAGLIGQSLTLEPIAAIEATIPPDLRRMNIALVDVGAGTSDIAITREGSVCAFAMVTQAGDEITERLCEQYLLEFNEAERVKRSLEPEPALPVVFKTILGQTISLPAAEISAAILPEVQSLAQAIAASILKLNGKAPRAVIMVGGGSRTPRLGNLVAEALEIETNRVGCRGPESIIDLENPTEHLQDIQGITTLGIAMLALHRKGLKFVTVQLNQQSVQLLSLVNQPTVFDVLLASGREARQLYPRPGQAITYTLEGKVLACPGTLGQRAVITLNGQPAGLDTLVAEGALIGVVDAIPGEDARLMPTAIPKPSGPFWCTLNGTRQELTVVLADHRLPLSPDEPIADRAELSWISAQPLQQLAPNLAELRQASQPFNISVNGEKQTLARGSALQITANGQTVDLDYRPRPNDRIEWHCGERPKIVLQEVVKDLPVARQITVLVNGKPKQLDVGGCRVFLNGSPVGPETEIPENSEIVVERLNEKPPILSHVLDGLDLKPPKDAGPIQLLVDGQKAAFTTPLRDGCRVDITFS